MYKSNDVRIKRKSSIMMKCMIVLFVISVLGNLYMSLSIYDTSRHLNKQNNDHLSNITFYSENLNAQLERFLEQSSYINDEENKDILYDLWRIVEGERGSIRDHSISIIHYNAEKELRTEWSLMQYSLIRVDAFLKRLTLKFLKQGNYVINGEEEEQLRAVIDIFSKLQESVQDNEKPVLIIDSLTEPMMLIDPNYITTLERLDKL